MTEHDLERRATERQVLTATKRALRNVAIGYIILMFGMGAGLYAIEKRDTHRAHKAIEAVHAAAKSECTRVNLLRRQANLASEIIFATLWVSAQRERTLAGGKPGPHEDSARQLEFLAGQALHTDLTDCKQAVGHPATYVPPRPRPFDPRTDPLAKRLEGL